MNILLIGNGGREHALAWKIKQSPLCDNLFIAPGNAGSALEGSNVAIAVDDFTKLASFCRTNQINLVVIGPEVPLVKGLRDYLEQETDLKLMIVGPGQSGARLEGSKDFSKQFMFRHGVPTANAKTFAASEISDSLEYVSKLSLPIVLKADGLAAGKGVVIAQSVSEAQSVLKEMLEEKKFGEASAKVLIEEFLDGIELSVFVLTDGKDYVLLPEAKDYKRIGDNDTGPNTGGMGAVSPVAFADAGFMKKIEERIIRPTIDGLSKEGIPYRGFIFFGLINVQGEPFVIEYNARMGDPETEVVFPRIASDVLDLMEATADGRLADVPFALREEAAATVFLVSGGYPGLYERGKVINGLDDVVGSVVFHAGTKHDDAGIVTDGGRVLAVTSLAADIQSAVALSLENAERIQFEGKYFRKDIGWEFRG